MNILYLTNHLNIGGITTYVLLLSGALKSRGHGIYIASSGGEPASEITRQNINYICIPIFTKKEISPKIYFCTRKLTPLVVEHKIDIIHANSRTTAVLAALLSRKCGVPFVVTCHGFFQKRILRMMFPCWGDKTIAISEQVKDHLMGDFKVKENNIFVIYNGIDGDKYKGQGVKDKGQAKKELGLGQGPVIGIVARLSDVKGHIYLVYAMRDLLKKIPDAQLLIVGDGREKKNIENAVVELGLRKNIFLFPAAEDPTRFLAAMDVFAMPSLAEGLGLSLMEAMASALPVIGSDIGGIRSLIQNGINGILVKTADSREIAKAILDLLSFPDKARAMGKEAARFIRERYSLEKMILDTERLYSQCLEEKKL